MKRRRALAGIHGVTLLELLVIVGVIGILTSLTLPMLTLAHEGARRVSCASNLRQTGLSVKMYAAESNGFYPPMAQCVGDDCAEPNRGVLMFAGSTMYPEYVPDAEVLVCPSDVDGLRQFETGEWRRPDPWTGLRADGPTNPCLIDDLSYTYFPWVFHTEWIVDPVSRSVSPSFLYAVGYTLFSPESPWCSPSEIGDLYVVDASGEERTLQGLREGVERFLITDINDPARTAVASSQVPVMFDNVSSDTTTFNHGPDGGNVLFMDGHVEFVAYPSRTTYPLTSAWAEFITKKNLCRAIVEPVG